MTIDSGAGEAANDTAVAEQNAGQVAAADNATDQTEGDAPELDADGNPLVVEETEELEWDGKKWVLPKDVTSVIKPALLRQADYTRKTQEVAERNRALEAREKEFEGKSKLSDEVLDHKAEIKALDKTIAQYDKIDWDTWAAQDPERANAAWRQRTLLIEQRDSANRALSSKEAELQDGANRERGERARKAFAELPKLVSGWSQELGTKLDAYGLAEGISPQEMLEATIQNPLFVKLLNKARLYDEGQAKQKTQQTFEQSQQAKPVTRVGGSGGSAVLRTTDPTGDRLSTDEWMRRERERVAKRGRR